MTDEADKPAKRRRAPKTKPTAAVLWYAAMHETNVALCLASGFVAPRLEENAARDHHLAAGRIVLEPDAPSAVALQGASADLAYGVVVVLEIERERLVPSARDDSAAAIPLAAVRRLLFADEQSRLEFDARTSAYADVPADLVPYEVDASKFLARSGSESHPAAQQASLSEEAVLDDRPGVQTDLRRSLALLDRTAGLYSAALSTLDVASGSAGVLSALPSEVTPAEHLSTPAQIAWKLATNVDPTVDATAYKPLLDAIVATLLETDAADGFSAASLLKKLGSALGGMDDSRADAPVRRFLKFAQDVVALRREIPDGSFADVDGSAIPRGALLFLLNPEPETLAAVRLRTPGLGSRVYFVAAMLVGLRAGLTRLPASFKANRTAFLAVPQVVLAGLFGRASPLAVRSHWEPSGSRVSELSWEGLDLARSKSAADPEQQALVDLCKNAGLALEFSPGDGSLSARVRNGDQEGYFGMRYTLMPTFPPVRAIEADLRLECSFSKRVVGVLIATANEQTRTTGLYTRAADNAAGRGVVTSAYVAVPATVAAVDEVLKALWLQAPRWTIVAKPETSPAVVDPDAQASSENVPG